MSPIEKMRRMVNFYDWQSETFNSGIKSISDLERLWDYAEKSDSAEFPDTWEESELIVVLGYNPWDRKP